MRNYQILPCALSMLLLKITKGVNDPKAPQRGKGMKWWHYTRDMRRNAGD